MVMSVRDAMALDQPAADRRVAYGEGALQFADLRLPNGEGPFPVVVIVHGGCWLAEYDLGYMSGLAEALTELGFATWSIEYRRVGDEGGGWPGTFLDVAAGADHLRLLADEEKLDLKRVVVLGHSAGGHLALWLAGRRSLMPGDELRGQEPLDMRGVVALAGIPDLAAYASPDGCGAAVEPLLGGDPQLMGDRLLRTSPVHMLPLGVRQSLLVGRHDPIVPVVHAERYVDQATSAGDEVALQIIDGVGHFELIDSRHGAFQEVATAVRRLSETR